MIHGLSYNVQTNKTPSAALAVAFSWRHFHATSQAWQHLCGYILIRFSVQHQLLFWWKWNFIDADCQLLLLRVHLCTIGVTEAVHAASRIISSENCPVSDVGVYTHNRPCLGLLGLSACWLSDQVTLIAHSVHRCRDAWASSGPSPS